MSFLKVWFLSHYPYNESIDIAKSAENAGYDYILIPFKTGQPDPFTKALIVLQNTKRINILIALPGYVISKEYLIMFFKSLNELFPNRQVLINIIDGGPEEEINKYGVDRESIKDINRNFVESLKSTSNIKFVFSGSSEATSKNVEDFGEFQLVQIYDFEKNDKRNNIVIPRIIICARETEQEANLFVENSFNRMKSEEWFSPYMIDRLRKTCLVGSYDSVADHIKTLFKNGAGGIAVSDLSLDNNDMDNVHEAIRRLS